MEKVRKRESNRENKKNLQKRVGDCVIERESKKQSVRELKSVRMSVNERQRERERKGTLLCPCIQTNNCTGRSFIR
jgi:hypothetical protein